MPQDTMSEIISRIKSKRIELGYSFQDLANVTNMSKSTLQRYESGSIKNIPLDKLKVLASGLKTTPEWIMGWQHRSPIDLEHEKDYYSALGCDCPENACILPVLGKVRAGIPIEAITDIVDYEEISLDMLFRGDYFALRVVGNSMEPKFSEGDNVIVRKQPDLESGEIGIILINGSDATIKQVIKHQEGGISLIASNPIYPPRYFTDLEIESLPISILGKVVELRAKF